MNLIYYYPMDKGSPSNVARKLFTELTKHTDSLPFKEIIIFSKREHIDSIKKDVGNFQVIDYKELGNISGDYLVHFPVLPTILPNGKFLLYLYSRFVQRKKIIIQYHGDVRTELKSSYKDIRSLVHILSYIFLPNLLKSVDTVITHSYSMNTIIKNYGVSKSVVIPNAIDSYWFQKDDDSIYLNNVLDKRKLNIFYHGRLSWEKGVDLLLEAVERCMEKNSNIVVYLAGEGPQKKYLEDLCSKLDINKNVVFLGTLSKEEIKFFLKHVDLAMYPSRFDNFPLAVLEALTCANCPVYFSKNIGIYDFAIKSNILLNYFELNIEEISKILNSSAEERRDIRCQVEFAKNYSWDLIICKYIEVYNSILKS